jgi:hypothetical protein
MPLLSELLLGCCIINLLNYFFMFFMEKTSTMLSGKTQYNRGKFPKQYNSPNTDVTNSFFSHCNCR